MSISESTTPVRPTFPRHVVFTKLTDEESVLLHLNTQQYYSLNETGTFICEHLEEGSSIDGIATALHRHYDVGRAEARQHVNRFLSGLQDEGLVEMPSAD